MSWNFTAHTGCLCYRKVAVQHELAKSQILTVLSPEEVARCEPAGWKSTPQIQSLWPSPDIMSDPSCCIFHIFHVQSSLTVAMNSFREWIAMLETLAEWAYRGRPCYMFVWKSS